MRGFASLISPVYALLLAPLLLGLINRTKAFVAGRRGPPLLQPYLDIAKCLRRGAVYGDVTSWIFRLGPVVNLSVLLAALLIAPLGAVPAPLSFPGDLIVLTGLLALGRFAIVLAALDAVARGAMTFVGLGLCENSRMPVDDPTTHLELTMIHEVMVLDHGGPDLGYIHYAAALKLWILGSLLVGLVVPLRSGAFWLDGSAMLVGMAVLAVAIGMIESAMARYRLVHVPQFIVGVATLSAVGFILILV